MASTEETGIGCADMIAVISEACEAPVNAFFPVSIS